MNSALWLFCAALSAPLPASGAADPVFLAQAAPRDERPRPLTAPAAAPGPAAARPHEVVPQPGEVNVDLRRTQGRFSFEFSKAEIIDVVRAISDMTRQNFIVPEKIKGQRITILSPTKVTAQEAYQVFFTALASNGISLVKSGRFYKLMDSKEAIKDAVPTCVDDDPSCRLHYEQMVTLILHLHHTDAAQINAVARTLISKDGDVTIFAPSNALIISEYAPNLRRLRKIIESLDVPGGDDDLQLMQVHNSLASELAEKITQVFDVQARGGSSSAGRSLPGSSSGGAPGANEANEISISKIVADDRTNQLIVKANRRSFNAVKNLIARLDVAMTEAEQGRVHVYYLENAKAEDLASTLSNLSGSGGGKKGAPNSGMPGTMGMNRNAPPGGDNSSLFEGEVKINADKATNSLLVLSSAHDYRAIRAIIEKLDRPRRQVYVEAAIMEVTLDDNEQLGLNWHAPVPGLGDPTNKNTPVAFLQSATNASVSPTFSALLNVSGFMSAAAGSLGGLFAQGSLPITAGDGSSLNLPKFGVLLKWLQTSSNLNLLSTPHIITTDNEQAHIEVGQKVPFNTGFFGGLSSSLGALGGQSGASGGAGALGALGGIGALGGLGSVQRIDVSLKLTLTPQINEGDKVRLEIDQVVEDLASSDPKVQTPATSHRQLKTVVVVDDQQTIVLGGLMRDKTSESESKIPFISEIPILGYLFKTRTVNTNKINLLLVLTPHIISGPADMQRIFERKMAEDQEFRDEFYGGSPAYRAHINYARKVGVLGRMVGIVRRERQRLENGGDSDASDIMIKPKVEGAKAADGDGDGDGGSGTSSPADSAGESGLRGLGGTPGASFQIAPEVRSSGERARDRFDLQPESRP